MLAARPPPPGSTSTAASHSSGRRTVRDCTIGSYCSNSGRREAMFGLEISSSSATRIDAPGASVAGGGGYSGSDGFSGARS